MIQGPLTFLDGPRASSLASARCGSREGASGTKNGSQVIPEAVRLAEENVRRVAAALSPTAYRGNPRWNLLGVGVRNGERTPVLQAEGLPGRNVQGPGMRRGRCPLHPRIQAASAASMRSAKLGRPAGCNSMMRRIGTICAVGSVGRGIAISTPMASRMACRWR